MSEFYIPEAELFANHQQVTTRFPDYIATFATAERFINSRTGITAELNFVSVGEPENRRKGLASHLVSRLVYDAVEYGSESFTANAKHPAILYIARTVFGAENVFESPEATKPLDFETAIAFTSEAYTTAPGVNLYVDLKSKAVHQRLGL